MIKRNRNKKASILDKATDVFLDSIARIERAVWKRIKGIIELLDRDNGKVVNNDYNQRLLFSLDRDLLGIATGALNDQLSPYLQNFDEVERLNQDIYGGFLSPNEAAIVSRMNFSAERTFLADEVTRSLTEPAMIRAQIIQPIRRILYAGITFNQPLSAIQANLRREILTNEGSRSKILRYTRQISQDAISQFDGAINDRIRDEIGADGFYYIGSIIKTTRSNCREMVTGGGRFASYAIEPGLFAVKDLKNIIAEAKGRSGWNDNCTPETFAQYRGGYGCRHEVIYVPLSDEQAKKTLAKTI